MLQWLQTLLYCEGINHEAGIVTAFCSAGSFIPSFHCTVTKRFHATCHQPLYETRTHNNRFLTTSFPFQSHLPSLQEPRRFIFSSLENITSSSPPVLNNMHMFRECYGNEALVIQPAQPIFHQAKPISDLSALVCIERGPNIMNQQRLEFKSKGFIDTR